MRYMSKYELSGYFEEIENPIFYKPVGRKRTIAEARYSQQKKRNFGKQVQKEQTDKVGDKSFTYVKKADGTMVKKQFTVKGK